MAIAFMYLAGRVPSMLGHHGTFDAWLHTIYFGMSLPGSMVRSARSIGLIAGVAAGGPPGIAAAAAATGIDFKPAPDAEERLRRLFTILARLVEDEPPSLGIDPSPGRRRGGGCLEELVRGAGILDLVLLIEHPAHAPCSASPVHAA